jgi:hypothetical protein
MYKFGGYGIDVKLHSMTNTPNTVWINGNSYVRVAPGVNLSEYEQTQLIHTNEFGEQYMIYSVNGIGEIRWSVNNSYDLNRSENKTVVEYFKTRKG